MCDNTAERFENLSKEEKLKEINEMLDSFLTDANDDEKAELMMNIMPKMMGNGMSMMKKMCHQMMGNNMFAQEKRNAYKENKDCCAGENKETTYATPEIKNLFEDWVCQVQEEIDKYRKENKNGSKKEIAEYMKISEESLEYFIKDMKSDVSL